MTEQNTIQEKITHAKQKLKEKSGASWLDSWVYINSHASYMHRQSMMRCKTESFNIQNYDLITQPKKGKEIKPASFAMRNALKVVDSITYLPAVPEQIINRNGIDIFNTFRPESVPKASSIVSPEATTTFNKIYDHIALLCNNNETDTLNLFYWLCHNIQFMGVKINWLPIIQSIQGIGKSYLGTLLAEVMGRENIGVVSSSQIMSQFNGWASGKCINILEELRVKGQNRHEASNAIKPLITDSFIQINDKGVAPYQSENITNYIAFTNFKDSLPMDETDRRAFVIFCNIQDMDEFESKVNQKKEDYFKNLITNTKKHALELRNLFLSVDIPDSFKTQYTAPKTQAKVIMAQTELATQEGVLEIQDMINELDDTKEINTTLLFQRLNNDYGLFLNDRQKGGILKTLGYSFYKIKKIDQKCCRFWSK